MKIHMIKIDENFYRKFFNNDEKKKRFKTSFIDFRKFFLIVVVTRMNFKQ